ncbi:MAG: hypothetical protein ORN85_08795, partial [Sediminibacterium sp.]|nr:hypothetical protein [Sediminibacterium sp.]
IYTTSAFLKPMKTFNGERKYQWLWVVSEFTDDSFFEGKTYNTKEFANSKEDLIQVPKEI